MKTDLYSSFALPHEAIEAARVEERRLGERFATTLPYELAGAILSFQRAVCPMLSALVEAAIRDDEWTRVYVTQRAATEADRILADANARHTVSLAWAKDDLKAARVVVDRRARDAANAAAFAEEEATRRIEADERAEEARKRRAEKDATIAARLAERDRKRVETQTVEGSGWALTGVRVASERSERA